MNLSDLTFSGRKRSPRAGAVLLILSSLVPATSCIAQTITLSSEKELGIIVTPSPETAQEVVQELKGGMDFCIVAKEKSTDSTAEECGYMGRMNPDQLRDDLRQGFSSLKPGQISGVVPMPKGFAVLTVFTAAPNRPDLDKKRIAAMGSSKAVRQSIVVSGQGEAKSAFDDFPKTAGWDRTLDQPCAIRKASMADAIDRMQKLLKEAESQPAGEVPPRDLLEGYTAIAELQAYVGQMQPSIEAWLKAYKIAETSFPASIPYLQETIGISYLHQAEMENGIYKHPSTLDIFPPADPRAHFEKQEHVKLAIEYFIRYLDQRPDDQEVRWMLNLAYVAMGQYSSGVPAKYLIPASTITPDNGSKLGRFTDVASSAGLKAFKTSGGIIVDDFDNDGLLDVMASSNDMCEQLQFFHNNGDGTFTDRTAEAGLTGQIGGLNIVEADYNNDGCMDLLVLRGGWEFPMRRSLLKNNCNGTFTDVTDASGLGAAPSESQTAAWADIDNDGFVDLFIANEKQPSQLFRNRGDGTFEDISHAAGIDRTSFSKGVVAADYDKDGYVDFYVSNISDANLLFHNNHDNTFTEVARMAGVQAPLSSFSAWFFDYDNDGWPDLFVSDYFSSVDEVMRSAQSLPFTVETPRLYRNNHDGTFADVTTQAGLGKVYQPMGTNFGDIDNDGYVDIYLGMGDPSFVSMMPHTMLHNKDGKSFEDVTAATGLGEIHKGHGIAFADIERNGYEDIVMNTAGAVPSEKHALRLFQNPGNENDWINLHLIGVKSNRAAIGAEIKVTVQNESSPARSIYRTVGDTSSFGGNPMEQHIGLGKAAHILSVEIFWPASKTHQKFNVIKKNQFFEVKEFAKEPAPLVRKPFQLAGGKSLAPVR